MRSSYNILCFLLLSSSLATSPALAFNDAQKADLAGAASRWDSQGVKNYRVTVRRSCECPKDVSDPVVVTVRGGKVVSRRYAGDNRDVATAYSSLFPSVEEAFRELFTVAAGAPTSARVQYDKQLGYPKSIWVDRDIDVVDDELSYAISGSHKE